MATSNDTAAMLCHDHHNPPPASPTYLHSWDNICFLHPGYVDGANRLLSFPRVDLTRQGSSQYGVHHRTALVACQIIGGNAFSGYLALDSKGEKKAHHDTDLDGILMEKEYYFIVPGEGKGFLLGYSLLFFTNSLPSRLLRRCACLQGLAVPSF